MKNKIHQLNTLNNHISHKNISPNNSLWESKENRHNYISEFTMLNRFGSCSRTKTPQKVHSKQKICFKDSSVTPLVVFMSCMSLPQCLYTISYILNQVKEKKYCFVRNMQVPIDQYFVTNGTIIFRENQDQKKCVLKEKNRQKNGPEHMNGRKMSNHGSLGQIQFKWVQKFMEKIRFLLNSSFRDFYQFYKRNQERHECDIRYLQLLVNSYCICSKITLPNSISQKKNKNKIFKTQYIDMKRSNNIYSTQSPILHKKNQKQTHKKVRVSQQPLINSILGSLKRGKSFSKGKIMENSTRINEKLLMSSNSKKQMSKDSKKKQIPQFLLSRRSLNQNQGGQKYGKRRGEKGNESVEKVNSLIKRLQGVQYSTSMKLQNKQPKSQGTSVKNSQYLSSTCILRNRTQNLQIGIKQSQTTTNRTNDSANGSCKQSNIFWGSVSSQNNPSNISNPNKFLYKKTHVESDNNEGNKLWQNKTVDLEQRQENLLVKNFSLIPAELDEVESQQQHQQQQIRINVVKVSDCEPCSQINLMTPRDNPLSMESQKSINFKDLKQIPKRKRRIDSSDEDAGISRTKVNQIIENNCWKNKISNLFAVTNQQQLKQSFIEGGVESYQSSHSPFVLQLQKFARVIKHSATPSQFLLK